MLRVNRKNKRAPGQTTLEITVILVFVISAFLLFQKYFTQALTGRWKAIGEGFSQGRLYDANTIKCAFDEQFLNAWYDHDCFRVNGCARLCYSITVQANVTRCTDCIQSCFTPYCD